MKTMILSGFLGSGKTTILMQLAHYLVDNSKSTSDNKVMIIENEIGEIGIDDMLLRSGGLEVSNLFSGCACCSVSDELISTAGQIKKEYDPEWMIVETTGVAYPKMIQENLKHGLSMESSIVVIVDAKRWNRIRKPMEALLNGQIIGSDCVLINKCDLVEEDVLRAVIDDIKDVDPETKILSVSAIEKIKDQVFETMIGD